MAGSVLTYLDGYCERAGQLGVMAEPLNLFTNLFFIVAAVLVARGLLRTPAVGKRVDLWLLALFLFAIGIGSGLWHAEPNGHTVLMDVVPITLFINLYILSALRRLFNLSWVKVVVGWGVYFAAGIVAQMVLPPDLLNGTIMYIPTYVMLAVLTMLLLRRDVAAGKLFAQALVVWTFSLLFRTIDMQFCAHLPLGTHFLWHSLNAWVLWRLAMVLVRK